MKKNIEKSEAPTRMPTTLAPVMVRSRKIEKGTSGAREQQDRRSGEHPDRLRRAPTGVFGVEQGEDQGGEAEGDRRRAGDVEGSHLLLGTRFGDQRRGDRGGGDPDRDVDPENPLPAEAIGEDPAEEHARGAAGARDRAPDPQRLVALGAVFEGGGDDREGGRGEDRGAEPLDGSRRHQLAGVGGEPTAQRGEGEEHEPEHEDAAAAEQVGEPSPQQEEAAEGEDVGVDDPGQAALGEVERFADRRQGDVDDRSVEHDHELRRAEQDQRDPALVAGVGGVGHETASIAAEDFTSASPPLLETCGLGGGCGGAGIAALCSLHVSEHQNPP
jgi:hypothetical protein